MKIVISGSHGLIGSRLCEFFTHADNQVYRLTRYKALDYQDSIQTIPYDHDKGEIDVGRLEGADLVIHLAGENLADRTWSRKRKRQIFESRVHSTSFLARSLTQLHHKPKMLITASAIGYYGPSAMNAALTEDSPPGHTFLSQVCNSWENAAAAAVESGIAVVHLRFGAVLSRNGGILAKLLPLFQANLGGYAGDGQQPVSWIALDEIPEIITFLMAHADITGAINCVAPAPVTNETFSLTLARLLKKTCACRVPGLGIRWLWGEMGDELILKGCDARPARLIKAGYLFKYPTLDEALRVTLK